MAFMNALSCVIAAQCLQLQQIHFRSKLHSGKCCASVRQRGRMQALPGKEYSLWGEDDADGKATDFEEGIFERVVDRPAPPQAAGGKRNVVEQIEVPKPRLVPEKWKDLQEEINRTKRQKRNDILQSRLARSKDEKFKLREKLSSIIDEAIDSEGQPDADAEITHTVFADGGRRRTYYRHEEETVSGDESGRKADEDFDEMEEDGDHQVESFGEDEWPPIFPQERPQEISPPGRAGRAVPLNPRNAIKSMSFEELSEKMNAAKPTAHRKFDPDDDNSLEGVFFTPEEKKVFRKRDPDFDKLYSEKWMPLHALACAGQTFLLAELLQQGVRVDDRDKDGVTALFKAVQVGRLAVTKHLIKGGANVFFRDKHGATLLHHGVASGNPSLVKLLLKYGVPIDSIDNEGWTPLHVAVQCQKKDLVRSLLKRGADRNIANKDGNTPLDLAFGFGAGFNSNGVIKLLKLQKPVLGAMRGFKGCEEVAAKLASEGFVDDVKTHHDQSLADEAKETQNLLVKVKSWAKNDLL